MAKDPFLGSISAASHQHGKLQKVGYLMGIYALSLPSEDSKRASGTLQQSPLIPSCTSLCKAWSAEANKTLHGKRCMGNKGDLCAGVHT